MTIPEFIEYYKSRKWTKEELEVLQQDVSYVYQKLQLEIADLKMEEALFMGEKTPEQSVADRKRLFSATKSGQRLIQLKGYDLSVKEMLSAIKSKIFQLIY